MPELPEVERATRQLRKALTGRAVAAVETFHPSQRRALPPAAAAHAAGQRVIDVTRRAKTQRVALANGATIEIHFRMNGDWEFGRTSDEPPRFERVRFDLDDGTRVSLVDSRALSVVRVFAAGEMPPDRYGPEPLTKAFDLAGFRTKLARRTTPIKPVLLDQAVVAGLGNIYAAEALWEAKIDPRAAANSLSPARVARLFEAIPVVLKRAPAARYYERNRPDEGKPKQHDDSTRRVYGREGKPCARCGTAIKRITQAGRSTYYCGRCQR